MERKRRISIPGQVETAKTQALKSLHAVEVVQIETSTTALNVEPPPAGHPLEKLIDQWAEIAVSHAMVRTTKDPAGLIATVAGIDGAWGFGQSEDEALDDLRSVLVDWVNLKLEDGDDDIPGMEGVHLVIAQ